MVALQGKQIASSRSSGSGRSRVVIVVVVVVVVVVGEFHGHEWLTFLLFFRCAFSVDFIP